MQRSLATMAVLLLAGAGCSDVCGSPDQLNGRRFASFATPRTFEIEGDADAFPAGSTPVNGEVTIGFEWASDLPQSPVAVTLDGQRFEDGSGRWSQVNCGTFTATWGGDYIGDDGAEHSFVASGYFVEYDGQLEGFVDWEERWSTEAGETGSYASEVLLRGEQTGG